MGVRGLTEFIRSDDAMLIKNYKLHKVKMVIDANNLARALLERVEHQDRTDRVGVNLVAYGKQVELFFDNLRKCEIEPTLVFHGAHNIDAVTSTTSEKKRQIKEQLKSVEKLIRPQSDAPPPVVHPACTSMILKSIAIEKQVQVVQCFYGADRYIAKMANDCDGFVLSGNADLFIFEINRGVILMESLKFEDIKTQISEEQSGEKIKRHFCIECDLFEQNHFLKAFPGLDKNCLPLFAGIASTDVSAWKLDRLLHLASPDTNAEFDRESDKGRLQILLKCLSKSDDPKEQSIASLLRLVDENEREEIKASISNCIRYYNLPDEDDFEIEFFKHYSETLIHGYVEESPDRIDGSYNLRSTKDARILADWLRKKIETANLTETCLELRNTVFLRPEMDDFTQPSAHNCFKRYLSVLSTFMRSSHKDTLPPEDTLPCTFYDREGDSSKMLVVEPLLMLKNYGSIDHVIYDLCKYKFTDDLYYTKLEQERMTVILLVTFHSSLDEYLDDTAKYEKFLQPQHAREFAIVKLLLKYVELEDNITFQPRFRRSLLVTYLYYLHFGEADVKATIIDDADESYLEFLDNLKQLARVNRLEDIDQWNITDYDITIVRNITQMQTAIRAYEGLKAFFDVEYAEYEFRNVAIDIPTLRMHKWFNSSFIYNFAAIIGRENLQLPSFVDDQQHVARSTSDGN